MTTEAAAPLPAGSAPAPLTLEHFERRYGINGPARRVSRELYTLLTSTSAEGPLGDRVRWLESLLEWVLSSRRSAIDLYGANGIEDARTARLTFLVTVLSREQELAERTRGIIRTLTRDGSIVRLLCSTGLPSEGGFFSELGSRIAANVLPEAPDDRDLSRPLLGAFHNPEDIDWLAWLDLPRVTALLSAFFDDEARAQIQQQRDQALTIVSTRLAALGLSEEFMARAGDIDAFLKLTAAIHPGPHRPGESPQELLEACRESCHRVRAHLEQYGVSTDLVFRLETIHQGIDRMLALMQRAPSARTTEPTSTHEGASLLATVLTDARRQRSVRSLVTASSRQLAKKIVERSGSTGDHYITSSRREWFGMLASAGGGGVLTAATTWFKFSVTWLSLPLFFEGAVNATNYALSFLVMQVVGFSLATKQPSMTAAALARALEQDRGVGNHETVITLVARIVRSQLAAVMGNLGFVIPACIAADIAHQRITGQTFLDAYAGHYVVGTLHLAKSGTIFYAALTGVLLWLSSVCAGWLDNWVAYHQLPAAVSHNRRLNGLVGRRMSAWLGRALGRAASGFAGCVSLGVFLGMVPLASKMFGLPLDVRHVTLSTGALTFAFRGMGMDAFVAAGGLWAVAGIGVIGMMNFGVSFICALLVAVRARDITLRQDLRLFGALLRAFIFSPARFFFPPASEPSAHAEHKPAH